LIENEALATTMLPASRMTITALLTCFNRKEKTLACLRNLEMQDLPGTDLRYVVVDDGSTDGTGEAVKHEFPAARMLRGNGSLYWCGGMRVAWSHAAEEDPDYYLMVNDDTLLDPGALQVLLQLAPSPQDRVIALAAIRDPETGQATYGGQRDISGLMEPDGRAHECDTLNGNAVLVPRAVYQEIGMLHGAYSHAMGDLDYGYLAKRHGIKIIQSPEFLGTCPRNSRQNTWMDRSLGRRKRLRLLRSKKGLPFSEWMTYNRRNAGWSWPWKTVSPYIRVLLGL
jgi:GT2 family glycosyltransferase